VRDVGKFEAIGMRSSMEDVSSVIYLNKYGCLNPEKEILYIGVFDGHSGKKTAEYASWQLPKEIISSVASITDIKAAIENAFMNTDEKWRRSSQDDHRDSGSCANICLICPDRYICANIGDTRCVLGRDGTTVPLSFDHKPHLPEERKRIEAAGSFVGTDFNGGKEISRVRNLLAVSRAFGDFYFKKCPNKAARDQAVTAFPEITEIKRDASDNFIILACDGVWDVITSSEAADYIYDCIDAKDTAAEAAEALGNRALAKGSTDNVSCIVVYL